mmetsp:Transcript_56484/g.183542  ORF Transcript_56484/g.183542 Transcript_56484/m.183542 type:complete len:247 (+) Transcript_56484:1172-1912(+)
MPHQLRLQAVLVRSFEPPQLPLVVPPSRPTPTDDMRIHDAGQRPQLCNEPGWISLRMSARPSFDGLLHSNSILVDKHLLGLLGNMALRLCQHSPLWLSRSFSPTVHETRVPELRRRRPDQPPDVAGPGELLGAGPSEELHLPGLVGARLELQQLQAQRLRRPVPNQGRQLLHQGVKSCLEGVLEDTLLTLLRSGLHLCTAIGAGSAQFSQVPLLHSGTRLLSALGRWRCSAARRRRYPDDFAVQCR